MKWGKRSEPEPAWRWWNEEDDERFDQLLDGLDPAPEPFLRELGATEFTVKWILLYEHIQYSKIPPEALRKLPIEDLHFLAAIHPENPAFFDRPSADSDGAPNTIEQMDYRARMQRGVKVAENVAAARVELDRRLEDQRVEQMKEATQRAGLLAAGAAIVAAALTAILIDEPQVTVDPTPVTVVVDPTPITVVVTPVDPVPSTVEP